MFEALMPVASSSSPTHDIYGLIIISVVVSFQRRNKCEHTQCSLWFRNFLYSILLLSFCNLTSFMNWCNASRFPIWGKNPRNNWTIKNPTNRLGNYWSGLLDKSTMYFIKSRERERESSLILTKWVFKHVHKSLDLILFIYLLFSLQK